MIRLISILLLIAVTNTVAAIETFDKGKPGTVPDNWQVGITGKGDSDWKLENDDTAPSSPIGFKAIR